MTDEDEPEKSINKEEEKAAETGGVVVSEDVSKLLTANGEQFAHVNQQLKELQEWRKKLFERDLPLTNTAAYLRLNFDSKFYDLSERLSDLETTLGEIQRSVEAAVNG